MAEWIDVKDRLRESGVWVLCLCQGDIYDVLKWNAQHWGWDKDKNHDYFRTFVKCWMPLPEPPKGEVENG